VTLWIRTLGLILLVVLVAAPAGLGADLDRTAVDFTAPADIKWVRNAAGTNEQAVLFGDPSKPGPYVASIKWLPGNMSRGSAGDVGLVVSRARASRLACRRS
jgi:hypothetical protein